MQPSRGEKLGWVSLATDDDIGKMVRATNGRQGVYWNNPKMHGHRSGALGRAASAKGEGQLHILWTKEESMRGCNALPSPPPPVSILPPVSIPPPGGEPSPAGSKKNRNSVILLRIA